MALAPEMLKELGVANEDELNELIAYMEPEDVSELNDLLSHERSSTEAPMPFLEFIRGAFPIVESKQPYVHGLHIEAITEHLEAVVDGDLRRLVINIPPRHMKSLLVSVFWPTWVWTFDPSLRWIFSSYASSLSVRDSLKCRRIIQSQWYRERFGHKYYLTDNLKMRFDNNKNGYRLSTSVGGIGTGEGGDIVVVDDPHNVTAAESETMRGGVIDWWDGEMSTRLNDADTGAFVVVMQRIHREDLVGHVLEQGGYEILRLPEKFEEENRCTTSIGWTDWRKEEGELIWPQRFSAESVEDTNRRLGPYRTAGQKQQRPTPRGGNLVLAEWWKWYDSYEMDFDEVAQSWDLNFKSPEKKRDPESGSFVVGQVWGRKDADFYLLDQYRERTGFLGSCAAIEQMSEKWTEAIGKYVENAANGPAVMDALQSKVAGLLDVAPYGSKYARLEAVVPLIAAGNVYLPKPTLCPWIGEFTEEVETFPSAPNDDQVDAMTQALYMMQTGGGAVLLG